jgi:hypothetical protein
VIAVVLVILAVSAWTNIWQQATTLNEARKRNQDDQAKIATLEAMNKNMEKQIEYATSSAYEQRKLREDLGLGESGDHWLSVDLGGPETGLAKEIPDSGSKTVIRQWWNLFAEQ